MTLPEPTVRPPSRMAKRLPSSIATGWSALSSTSTSITSPGRPLGVGFRIEPLVNEVDQAEDTPEPEQDVEIAKKFGSAGSATVEFTNQCRPVLR